jgi:hypothetical protein
MYCPECGQPGSEADVPGASDSTATANSLEALARCGMCGRPYTDSGVALLRLLTRLANCGLTAEAPTVLDAAETGSLSE